MHARCIRTDIIPLKEISATIILQSNINSFILFLSAQSMVVYHLHKDSSVSEWKINGTHVFGRPNRKITGINGLLEKVVLFDRLERFKRFISFHLHFFWVVKY